MAALARWCCILRNSLLFSLLAGNYVSRRVRVGLCAPPPTVIGIEPVTTGSDFARDGGPRQQDIVRLLIAAGADPTMTDQWGVSPLQHAQQNGYNELADILARALT